MKKIIMITIILIGYFFIPKYNELNNIILIDKITIKHIDNKYNIVLREKYLTKEENNLKYKYKYYYDTIENINNINKLYNKKFYLKKAKYIYK